MSAPHLLFWGDFLRLDTAAVLLFSPFDIPFWTLLLNQSTLITGPASDFFIHSRVKSTLCAWTMDWKWLTSGAEGSNGPRGRGERSR